MCQPRHILHPTDFSESAQAAFRHALHLARRHGSTVQVLHTVRFTADPGLAPFTGPLYVPDGYAGLLMKDAEAHLLTYVHAAQAAGVPVEIVPPMFDTPASAILRHAHEAGNDLIVMGTHGRRGLRRALLGSVAETVLRRASCSVLSVRARPDGADLPARVHRVLAPVDLAFYPEELVRQAAALARAYDASLTLLHVVDVAADPELSALPLPLRDRQLRGYEAVAHARLEALRELAGDPTPPVTCRVAAGDPWVEVPAHVDHLGADLVVAASHGLAGLNRLLLGSVAERITREADGAVFVLKPLQAEAAHPAPAAPASTPLIPTPL